MYSACLVSEQISALWEVRILHFEKFRVAPWPTKPPLPLKGLRMGRSALTFYKALLLERLQRGSPQDQLFQAAPHTLPLRVLQV